MAGAYQVGSEDCSRTKFIAKHDSLAAVGRNQSDDPTEPGLLQLPEHQCPLSLWRLRLGRLNWIYSSGSREENFTSLVRGYSFSYPGYSTFFQRNTQWLVGVLGYLLLVLTAMQVGLATDHLGHNSAFQNASYGFTAFSIVALMIVLGILVCYMALIVLFNALDT